MTEVAELTGRELDACVALAVFGDTVEPVIDLAGRQCWPRYSAEMSAAWLVVKRLAETGWDLELLTYWTGLPLPGCLARFHSRDRSQEVWVTTPLGQEAVAVCRAALLAVRNKR